MFIGTEGTRTQENLTILNVMQLKAGLKNICGKN